MVVLDPISTLLPTCLLKPVGISLSIKILKEPSDRSIPYDRRTGLHGTSSPLIFKIHAIESRRDIIAPSQDLFLNK